MQTLHDARLFQDNMPEFSQLHATGRTDEQRHAERFFQPFNIDTQGGLIHAKFICRMCHIFESSYFEELP